MRSVHRGNMRGFASEFYVLATFPDSPFRLRQLFAPAGDQPEAIAKLVEGWTGAESMWNGKADASTPEESTEAATVTLADGSEHRFQIVAKDPQLALVNPATGLRYALSKTLTDTLLALPEPKAEPATDIPAPESAR